MDGWKTVKLGDLFEFKNGLNKGVEYFGRGTPIVNYMDVNRNAYISQKDVRGLVEVTPSEKENCSAKKGDVFFTRTSETLDEIGLASVLLDDIEDCVFSGYVLRGRPKTTELLPKYCAYSLRTHPIRKEVMRKSSMTTRALTNGRFISDVDYSYPPKSIQRQIVAILEVWDEYLEKLDRKIEAKKIVKKGLMQQLLTGKARVASFNGIWETTSLHNLCNISTGKKDVNAGNPNGQYPFFTCSRKHTYSDNYSYDFEAILIAGNADVGHCKYYSGKFEAYQRTYILSNFRSVYGKYLFYYMSHFFKGYVESLKQIGAMSYIKLPMLKDFAIKLPDMTEQKLIADTLDITENEVNALERQRQLACEQRKYLLNNLVSGKITIPDVAETKEAVHA